MAINLGGYASQFGTDFINALTKAYITREQRKQDALTKQQEYNTQLKLLGAKQSMEDVGKGTLSVSLPQSDITTSSKTLALPKINTMQYNEQGIGQLPVPDVNANPNIEQLTKREPITGIGAIQHAYQTGQEDKLQTMPIIKQPKLDETQSFDLEYKLRNEYLKNVADYPQIRDSFVRVQNSAKNPSAAGDLALIFNYMKILDPASVVREGEFATAQNSGSVPERLRAMYNKVISGERLTDQIRNDFVDRATSLYQGREKQFKQTTDEFNRLSKSYNLDPTRVVTLMGIPNESNMPTFNSSEEFENAKLPTGTKAKINGIGIVEAQ